MKILITGINGFVGQNLANFLLKLKRKIKVYGIDIQGKNSFNKRIIFLKCDILKAGCIDRVLKRVKPDTIYHLAAQASVVESFKNPKETFKTNIEGTLNILEAVRKFCPKTTIVIPGSSEEYGKIKLKVKNQKLKISEKTPLYPLSPYAISKVCQELLGYQYFQKFGIKAILVRPFNITGPGQSDRAVCSRFAKEVAEIETGRKKPVIKVGKLEIVRDFTDVRDVARAYWLATGKCKPGQVYNIASGKGCKIEDILKKLLSLSRKKIKIKKDTSLFRKNEPLVLVGNAADFRKITGWKPKINFLNQTLPELLSYWRNK